MKRTRMTALRLVAGCLSLALAAAGCGLTSRGGPSDDGELLVWVDAVRAPGVQQYMTSHPEVKIRLVTITLEPGSLLTKISLANKSGSGWPDAVFGVAAEVAFTASPRYDYPVPLDDLVDPGLLDQFAPGSMDGCTFDGKLYCLRNDLGQTVLWYNQKLMAQFGYAVPKTWAEYQSIGMRVAKEHPGFTVGVLGGKFGAGTFFSSSGCPTRQVVDRDTVKIDTSDSKCTRVSAMLQPLAENRTLAPLQWSDPAFVQVGQADKVLMLPGPSWYGEHVFKNTFKTPPGEIAAAPMPIWPEMRQPMSGSVGGGMYAVSRHASDAKQRAAADLITWLATDIGNQTTAPTYPAYAPAAQAWCTRIATIGFYAQDPCPVLDEAAGLVSPVHGFPGYQPAWVSSYNETVVAAAKSGGSLTAALLQWQQKLVQGAEAVGYGVEK